VNEPGEQGPTWVACLTGPGQAALATLGLHGPRAWAALREVFRTRSGKALPAEPEVGRFWLGRLGGEVADEVVAAVRSIEPVPSVEVHCHGGREVVCFLIELFTRQGLHLCGWEEFLDKTEGDALTATAAIALAHAATLRTAGILLDQRRGALGRALDAILPELDQEVLSRLVRHAATGRHLTRPWRVVVAGAANVGKSSLVNALAGYARSVVAETPGTTRDVVTARVALDGWLVELVDTAGHRTGAGGLEEQGMERARAEASDADLCLWVLDGAAEPAWPEREAGNVHLVVNKVDQPAGWDWEKAGEAIRVSAKTGQGLPALGAALARWLVPEPPVAGEAVPFTPWLCDGVERAWALVEAGDTAGARGILQSLRCGRLLTQQS
jgi:tRNA modification GTPase